MWKVPAKAAAGSTDGVAQARQAGQQHVDLELGALDVGLGRHRGGTRRGEQPVEDGGRAAREERAAAALPLPALPPAHATSPVEGRPT